MFARHSNQKNEVVILYIPLLDCTLRGIYHPWMLEVDAGPKPRRH